MTLIDEIEQAAERHRRNPYKGSPQDELAYELVHEFCEWERIRTVLKSAAVLSKGAEYTGCNCNTCEAVRAVRAAFESAKGE